MKDYKKSSKLSILHVDMDAFYAAVEEKDDPYLKNKPVIVGGLSKNGVVTTANYVAREYGIHSAMPAFKARRNCPQGFYLKPRMKRYRDISFEIFNVLYTFTDIIEKVSVDEAYMDISNIKEDPIEVVRLIKEKVYNEIGLTMSIGLSYNKFLAKLASDWNKPDGFKLITKDMVPEILYDLSINQVHGIGNKSAKKLRSIGVYKIKDLLRLDEEFLVELFGKSGREIYYRIRGIDNRRVNIERQRKSIGIERTFKEETSCIKELQNYLKDFSEKLSIDLMEKGLHTKTIIVKVKDEDFKTQTRSRTLEQYIYMKEDIYCLAKSLLGDIKINKKIRLLGITASNLLSLDLEQLSLFD